MFYVEHVYPVGSQIPDEETLKEMDDAIYDLYLKEEIMTKKYKVSPEQIKKLKKNWIKRYRKASMSSVI